jgi:amino-acid N-acetyltransferase
MTIRPATVADAAGLCELINHYAEREVMLHRSLESAYDCLREFQVAVDGERVIGCVAVDLFWANLAEIKSLAVAPDRQGEGIGSRLMAAALADARSLGVTKLFTLTYEQAFFARFGFRVSRRDTLPEKVWRECIACPRHDACDEIAMTLEL